MYSYLSDHFSSCTLGDGGMPTKTMAVPDFGSHLYCAALAESPYCADSVSKFYNIVEVLWLHFYGIGGSEPHRPCSLQSMISAKQMKLGPLYQILCIFSRTPDPIHLNGLLNLNKSTTLLFL